MFFCCTLSEKELYTKNERIELLIERLAFGNMNAMDELYALVKQDVFAYALSKTGNYGDAEDIVQDTFVQIYRYAPGYKAQGKPLAWIFTIVANLAKRKFIINERYTELEEASGEVSDGIDYDNTIVNREFLRQIMNTLTSEEQEIIVLHIVSGLKHIEIARLLNKPLSTILSKYNRAIKKLQKGVLE